MSWEEDNEQYTTNKGYDKDSQYYNIENIHIWTKKETIQNTFKVQDAEEIFRLESFHIV